MTRRVVKATTIAGAAVLAAAAFAAAHAAPQGSGQATGPTAISETGLLPIYGVDFNVDPTWVDPEIFPSGSPDFPHAGVSAAFQAAWDAVAPAGFSVIRYRVDVRDAAAVATRVANLCLWASERGVKLVPVLVAEDAGEPLGIDYAGQVSAFVTALLDVLQNADRLDLYGQVLAYQLGTKLNHAGLHAQMPRELAQLRLLQAAGALGKAERDTGEAHGVLPTPIMVDASFDFELITSSLMGHAPLDESLYVEAYQRLSGFLRELVASPDVDLVAVEYLPGSLGAGDAGRFERLLHDLTGDLRGKQVVLTTGFSTGFATLDAQREFYALTFANVAGYRATAGADAPFLGVIFREAFSRRDAERDARAATLAPEIADWDWTARAGELTAHWAGSEASDEVRSWLAVIERTLGTVVLEPTSAGEPVITAHPAQEALQAIAATVDDASETAPDEAMADPSMLPADDPSAEWDGSSTLATGAKERAQQFLLGLLDRSLEQLTGRLFEGDAAQDPDHPDAPPTGDPGFPADAAAVPSIVVTNVEGPGGTLAAGETATFSVMFRNQEGGEVSGLVAALVDAEGALVGPESLATDLTAYPGSDQVVELSWVPAVPGTYEVAATIADASYVPLATSPHRTVTVAPGPSSPPEAATDLAQPAGSVPYTLPVGLPIVTQLSAGTVAGLASPVVVSLTNPFPRALTQIKVSLFVDGQLMQTKTLTHLVPRMTRSVAFPSVRVAAPGSHEFRVAFERPGMTVRPASIVRRVQVTAAPTVRPPSRAAGAVAPRVVRAPIPTRVAAQPKSARRATAAPRGLRAPPAAPKTSPAAPAALARPIPSNVRVTAGDIRFEPVRSRANALAFSIPISNAGQSAVKDARVVCVAHLDGREIGRRDFVVTIGPRATSIVRWQVQAPQPGQVRLEVIVDHPGDQNAADNRAVVTVPVRAAAPARGTAGPGRAAIGRRPPAIAMKTPAPDLAIDPARGVAYALRTTRGGQMVVATIRVQNLGGGTAHNARVACVLVSDGRPGVQQAFAVTVPPGETRGGECTLPMPKARQHRLEVTASVPGDSHAGNERVSVAIRGAARRLRR